MKFSRRPTNIGVLEDTRLKVTRHQLLTSILHLPSEPLRLRGSNFGGALWYRKLQQAMDSLAQVDNVKRVLSSLTYGLALIF